jgi:transcriptional regulator with AAA-type ATPase domain
MLRSSLVLVQPFHLMSKSDCGSTENYRLNVFPIRVPPLRERVEDIPSLVWTFIDEFSKAFGKSIESISKDSVQTLQRYGWPGNIPGGCATSSSTQSSSRRGLGS